MQPKDSATVRVSNLSPSLGRPPVSSEEKLHHFFDRQHVHAKSGISVFPHSSDKDSSLVATVTFQSPSDAKRALNLNGRVLDGRNVSVERDFMGLTVLAAPSNPKLE